MKINLVETEIQDALVQFINNQGIDLSGKDVQVTLTAGRGSNGHSAQIEILPIGSELSDDPTSETEEPAIFSSDD